MQTFGGLTPIDLDEKDGPNENGQGVSLGRSLRVALVAYLPTS